ncbi:H-2 class II histocompatibility antigen, A-U alpha chain-like [Dunckerocampus dactyliophorus]|uniref:H-2 class II histocompatibility antigen, A-U alpha chain-like n=1 Tax=Dunckerocampus dactyliophorus TaxID=161453 RepID=UPI0024065597|nr:H-2 class II histocompatibility antigen, A-U alpha chain-like [Dunckerocampus dactyliophorus]
MKASLLLLLLCGVSADNLHEDLHTWGCSDTDGEDVYALDDEVGWFADFANNRGVEPQPGFIEHMTYIDAFEVAQRGLDVCRQNLNTTRLATKDLPLISEAPSHPLVYPRDEVLLGEKNILICHVTDFYPAPVIVRWSKNGERVSRGDLASPPLPNKDGSFQQTSRLEFTPQQGDIYTCIVEHRPTKELKDSMWTVEVKQPGVGPAVFCGLGLTVGLLGVAIGTFFLIKGNQCS